MFPQGRGASSWVGEDAEEWKRRERETEGLMTLNAGKGEQRERAEDGECDWIPEQNSSELVWMKKEQREPGQGCPGRRNH